MITCISCVLHYMCRLILTKQNPNLVLTATTRSRGDATTEANNVTTYVGCTVTVQRKKTVQFGRANQRWRHDPSTGFIYAFSTDVHDKGKCCIIIIININIYYS